ncbi:hypothetical protein RJ55_03821 [Drechmeria coniospora]|nr:hypothetical protein RJ55_03821 [Drechmeria coniospora]
MVPTKSVYLSKVVLILGSFVGVDDILTLSENSRFELPTITGDVSRKGAQFDEEDLTPPFICLTLGQHLFDPLGWVFGSDGDSDQCDIQLAEDNQTGVTGEPSESTFAQQATSRGFWFCLTETLP